MQKRLMSPMWGSNALKIGILAPNCASGLSPTKVPERWDGSWDHNVELAKMADDAGLEFLLPIARWRGFRGETDFHGTTFESLIWATGMLAQTRRITVFGTVHTALFHPIVAAKQLVAADHAGHGRLGLNIVCGWNQDEFDMFGVTQLEHDARYEYGAEWWDIVQRIWSEEAPFDHEGRHFRLKGVIGKPRPFGGTRPVVLNAGGSPAGRDFAARSCDFLFTALVDLESAPQEVASIKQLARGHGRDLEVLATTYVVCRPTQREAEEYHHHYAEQMGDVEAAEHLMSLLGMHMQTFPPDYYQAFRARFLGGHGAFPIIGDPDGVARQLAQLREAGLSGVTISMVNFLDELPYFRDEVLPRLERLGLRRPAGGT